MSPTSDRHVVLMKFSGHPNVLRSRVLCRRQDMVVVELEMQKKYGKLYGTADSFNDAPPELYYMIDGSEELYTAVFPEFLGWEIILSSYVMRTITILFAKNLRGT